MAYTFEYYCEEHKRFMDLIGNKNTTQDMALKAWGVLFYVSIHTDPLTDKERNTIDYGLAAAKVNLDYRLRYFPITTPGEA